jgi:hypothetical protein
MKRLFLLPFVVMLLAIVACDPVIPDPVQKEKSTDLVIPPGFDWKTTQLVKVTVNGLSLPADFYSTLRIYDLEGNVLYTCNYNLRENISFDLTAPRTVNELNLVYGKRTIKSSIGNGAAVFSFMVN